MMELGVAYSYLYEKYQKRGEDYIFSFSVYPIRKGQALSGTPIANIQVGEINDEKDIIANDKNLFLLSFAAPIFDRQLRQEKELPCMTMDDL